MGKVIPIIPLILLIFMLGCAQQIETMQEQPLNMPMEGSEESERFIKEFIITAKRFDFTPSTLAVNKGDIVKITAISVDATHGFSLPDFNINERLEPNQPITVEFVADKAGEFAFSCSVPCGSGHSSMGGTLIVN